MRGSSDLTQLHLRREQLAQDWQEAKRKHKQSAAIWKELHSVTNQIMERELGYKKRRCDKFTLPFGLEASWKQGYMPSSTTEY